ncbi:MAG: SDR family oxidoreductase [Planctomycetota bacterium]|nr:SDR family oxidoreductase [Planctomycetota bacterium]
MLMQSTMLQDKTFLITGIADEHSLAMYVAKEILATGGRVICTGLGVSPFHASLSDRAREFLDRNYRDFEASVRRELGEVRTENVDVTLEDSVAALARNLKDDGVQLHGFLHAIAMDKTIRQKEVKPLLQVTRDEFCDTLDVSAYSLIRLTHHLLAEGVLQAGASICSLSYIAAEKVTFHPYRNMSVAKAALERITVELADELGRLNGTRVNALRFSPYLSSKAGNATLNSEDVDTSDRLSPLGNALPQDLAREVSHLFRPDVRITGEIRHIDGGYHIMG